MVRRGRMSTVSSFDRGSMTLVTPGPAAMTISLGVESTPGVQVGYRLVTGTNGEQSMRELADVTMMSSNGKRGGDEAVQGFNGA